MAFVSAMAILLQVSAATGAAKPVAPAPAKATQAAEAKATPGAKKTATDEAPQPVDCTAPFRIVSAEFGLLSQGKRHVLSLVKNGGPELFVSIPTAARRLEWGLPLDVKYGPTNAVVRSMRIELLVEGVVKSTSESIPVDGAFGKISLPDLAMPAFPGVEPTDAEVNFRLVLDGELCGKPVESDRNAPLVAASGRTAFTPLFAADTVLPARRRYGGRDVGGDGWATASALDWLEDRPYRFDDITGLHAPQTPSGRSSLGHAGHSNGRQIDMRYADGSGGFSDLLGGAGDGKHIFRLIQQAQLEVVGTAEAKAQGGEPDVDKGAAAKPAPSEKSSLTEKQAPTGKPSPGSATVNSKGAANGETAKDGGALATLRAWVEANRTVIQSELADAERVYIGNTWLAGILRDGVFPDKTPVPSIGAWRLTPAERAKVIPVPGHLHHWHINLRK